MINKANIVILTLMLVLTSCGRSINKPTNVSRSSVSKDNNTNHIKGKDCNVYISNLLCYQDYDIDVTIDSKYNIDFVSYGFLNVENRYKNPSINNSVSFKVHVPVLQLGANNLFFLIVYDNKTNEEVTVEINVVAKAEFKLDIADIDSTRNQISVSGKDIISVEYIDENSESKLFKKDKSKYTLIVSEGRKGQLIVTDPNGLKQSKDISDIDVLLYGYSGYSNSMVENVIASYSTRKSGIVSKIDIKVPTYSDTYIKSILEYTKTKKMDDYESHYKILEGLSPDKRHALFLYRNILKPVNYIENKRRMESLIIYSYYLYDVDNRIYHHISNFYKKYFYPLPSEGGSLFEEIGSYYHPIYWDEDKLYMIEIKKSEGFFSSSDIKKYPEIVNMNTRELSQSLEASAKSVFLDLNDYKIYGKDAINIFSPWVSWVDQGLGIISWMDIKSKGNDLQSLPSIGYRGYLPSHVSVFDSSKVWDLRKISYDIPGADDKNKTVEVVGSFVYNDNKCVLLKVYSNNNTILGYLDLVSGNFSKLKEGYYTMNNIKYSLDTMLWSGTYTNKPIVIMSITPNKYNENVDITGTNPILDSSINGIGVFSIEDNKLVFKDLIKIELADCVGFIYGEK